MQQGLSDSHVPVKQAAVEALGRLLSVSSSNVALVDNLSPSLIKIVSDVSSSSDVRKTAITVVKRVGKLHMMFCCFLYFVFALFYAFLH